MNKENKLIFLISNFEQPIGGAQVHILTLIKIVYKNLKNTKIYLITGSINKEISRELKEFNIEIIENNLLKNNSKNNIPKIIKGIYEIRKLFCLINPDLISIPLLKQDL